MNKRMHDILDGFNSAIWFIMDACWMFELHTCAYVLSPFVVVTGVVSLFSGEKRADVFFSSLALNCWILMNVFWMYGDTQEMRSFMITSKVFFFLGLFSLILSVALSGDWKKTLSSFKRMRIK